MKKMLTPILSYAIGKAKRNKFIQNLFESPFDLNKFPSMGKFKDSEGNSHQLLDGLRSKIRPGWEGMMKHKKTTINSEYLEKKKFNGGIAVNKIAPVLESLGKSIVGRKVMEIGCHSGGTSYSLAELGAAEVVGTEFSGYKVKAVDSDDNMFENKLVEVNAELLSIRTELATLFKQHKKVKFVDDDICNSTLAPNSFDIICSWEVLEHLHDTQGAFNSISKLLKDDGIAIHEYNPFFCLNGGHSLCTLDMLWGHTRLNESDFEKYLDTYRPNEKDRALAFYTEGLNRMTLDDLRAQLKKADLEIVSIIPFTKEQHLRMVDQKILEQTQVHYPGVTLLDLCSPRVYVVTRKNRKTT